MANEANHVIQEAAVLGVIEILLQPEISDEWIKKDVLGSLLPTSAITDEMIDAVNDLIMARCRAIAATLVDELGDIQRAGYTHLQQ